jgi:hypothetical protein
MAHAVLKSKEMEALIGSSRDVVTSAVISSRVVVVCAGGLIEQVACPATAGAEATAEPSGSLILEQMMDPKPAMAASATTVVDDKELKPQSLPSTSPCPHKLFV